MNASRLNFSVYLGLFLAQWLAVVCNAFLDIEYGSFAKEMLFWGVVFGITLFVGWRQSHRTTAVGKVWQKGVLFFGLLLFVFAFMPLWGLPRAGLYLLAMLQASYNCVTTGRREMNLGLLVSLAIVLFAASHYRADWTLLFYLAPYIVVVVFCLVAEQIQRRGQDLKRLSLGTPSSQGQGAAILAATAVIVMMGGGLYLITPQINWPYLDWRFGQVSLHDSGGDTEQFGSGSQTGSGQPAEITASDQPPGTSGGDGEGQPLLAGSRWPSPAEMRAAAKRIHMPAWQAAAINGMANFSESAEQVLTPVAAVVFDWWEWLKHWLREHWLAALLGLLALILLAIFLAFGALLREIPWVLWLITQWDYLRLGVIGRHARGETAAHQYYRAMSRLFTLHDVPRADTANTREYLAQISRRHRDARGSAAEITGLFEAARYGDKPLADAHIRRMRQLYRTIYRQL
ncbi:DUF4129 domain-containing protein [Methylomonas albis]|uniref:DUF4129 domain-containing protein n=1 Tax=Methylomonas albis TaxID=1854563 RepID=A0ABR9CYA1_9GAMM|nr:DUF4129 domain-containing protein [Methylomonas albis]MBD9355861.1 DUF4129 domain-containing protein [Methylomonas albis]